MLLASVLGVSNPVSSGIEASLFFVVSLSIVLIMNSERMIGDKLTNHTVLARLATSWVPFLLGMLLVLPLLAILIGVSSGGAFILPCDNS